MRPASNDLVQRDDDVDDKNLIGVQMITVLPGIDGWAGGDRQDAIGGHENKTR